MAQKQYNKDLQKQYNKDFDTDSNSDDDEAIAKTKFKKWEERQNQPRPDWYNMPDASTPMPQQNITPSRHQPNKKHHNPKKVKSKPKAKAKDKKIKTLYTYDCHYMMKEQKIKQ